MRLSFNNQSVGYLFLLPAILLVLVVAFYPIFLSVYYSVHETYYMNIGEFVGLGNYLELLKSEQFIKNLINSLKYVIGSLLLTIPMSLLLALLLNSGENRKMLYFLRSIMLIPWVISQTVTGLLWVWILDPKFGPVNYITRTLFNEQISFLASPDLAMWVLIVANTWMSYPLATVLILAALQMVPPELYEAVEIDGGNAWTKFRSVTYPFIANSLSVTFIMLTVHFFNMVTLIYVMTGGGPLQMTEVMSLRIYLEAFEYQRLALASTVGTVSLILNILFAISYTKLLRNDF